MIGCKHSCTSAINNRNKMKWIYLIYNSFLCYFFLFGLKYVRSFLHCLVCVNTGILRSGIDEKPINFQSQRKTSENGWNWEKKRYCSVLTQRKQFYGDHYTRTFERSWFFAIQYPMQCSVLFPLCLIDIAWNITKREVYWTLIDNLMYKH